MSNDDAEQAPAPIGEGRVFRLERSDTAKGWGLNVEGDLVLDVTPSSPAARARVGYGCRVVAIDGRPPSGTVAAALRESEAPALFIETVMDTAVRSRLAASREAKDAKKSRWAKPRSKVSVRTTVLRRTEGEPWGVTLEGTSVADTTKKSPWRQGRIPPGARITEIDGAPVDAAKIEALLATDALEISVTTEFSPEAMEKLRALTDKLREVKESAEMRRAVTREPGELWGVVLDEGCIVREVTLGGPMARAHVGFGARIVEVDGVPMATTEQLHHTLQLIDHCSLEIVTVMDPTARNAIRRVQSPPPPKAPPSKSALPAVPAPAPREAPQELTLRRTDPSQRWGMSLAGSTVVSVTPVSPAEAAGIEAGAEITSVGGCATSTALPAHDILVTMTGLEVAVVLAPKNPSLDELEPRPEDPAEEPTVVDWRAPGNRTSSLWPDAAAPPPLSLLLREAMAAGSPEGLSRKLEHHFDGAAHLRAIHSLGAYRGDDLLAFGRREAVPLLAGAGVPAVLAARLFASEDFAAAHPLVAPYGLLERAVFVPARDAAATDLSADALVRDAPPAAEGEGTSASLDASGAVGVAVRLPQPIGEPPVLHAKQTALAVEPAVAAHLAALLQQGTAVPFAATCRSGGPFGLLTTHTVLVPTMADGDDLDPDAAAATGVCGYVYVRPAWDQAGSVANAARGELLRFTSEVGAPCSADLGWARRCAAAQPSPAPLFHGHHFVGFGARGRVAAVPRIPAPGLSQALRFVAVRRGQ